MVLAIPALRYYFFVLENRFSKLNYQVFFREMKPATGIAIGKVYGRNFLRFPDVAGHYSGASSVSDALQQPVLQHR